MKKYNDFDPWEHLEDEDNFVPSKPKTKKVRKMKMDRPLLDKKRK
jgi:hypothetical protein